MQMVRRPIKTEAAALFFMPNRKHVTPFDIVLRLLSVPS